LGSIKNILGQRQELNKEKPAFILHDAPDIFANGNIHILGMH